MEKTIPTIICFLKKQFMTRKFNKANNESRYFLISTFSNPMYVPCRLSDHYTKHDNRKGIEIIIPDFSPNIIVLVYKQGKCVDKSLILPDYSASQVYDVIIHAYKIYFYNVKPTRTKSNNRRSYRSNKPRRGIKDVSRCSEGTV